MHSTTSSKGIIIFVCLLSAFFAALKLLGLETISWMWVSSPIWITALSLPALFVIIALRCAYLSLRGQKAEYVPTRSRWKQWYDSLGNHPFVP
jgi:hypothetical protein